jgi:hypothetical protein
VDAGAATKDALVAHTVNPVELRGRAELMNAPASPATACSSASNPTGNVSHPLP